MAAGVAFEQSQHLSGQLTDRCSCFLFFNDTATTEIYTLSLHDALPIYIYSAIAHHHFADVRIRRAGEVRSEEHTSELQSRGLISYAVFCLKKNELYMAAKQLKSYFQPLPTALVVPVR